MGREWVVEERECLTGPIFLLHDSAVNPLNKLGL